MALVTRSTELFTRTGVSARLWSPIGRRRGTASQRIHTLLTILRLQTLSWSMRHLMKNLNPKASEDAKPERLREWWLMRFVNRNLHPSIPHKVDVQIAGRQLFGPVACAGASLGPLRRAWRGEAEMGSLRGGGFERNCFGRGLQCDGLFEPPTPIRQHAETRR